MNFYKKALIVIVFVLIFSACTSCDQPNLSVEELLTADIDFLVAEIQAMYDDIRPQLLGAPEYDPDIYIAFADIDFDGIPEFFYGYETMTGSHNKIWYRAYSLRDHAIIGTEHAQGWHTYIRDDEACSFFTCPKNFIEGYFLNDKAEPCFVTKAHTGPVTDPRTDFVFIQYRNSKLFIETGYQFDENLLPLKQAWSLTKVDSVKDDTIKLLNKYSVIDAK